MICCVLSECLVNCWEKTNIILDPCGRVGLGCLSHYCNVNQTLIGGKVENMFFSYKYLVLTWCVQNLMLLPGFVRDGCLPGDVVLQPSENINLIFLKIDFADSNVFY